MKLQVGCEFAYQFPQPTPCLLTLNIHHSRAADLESPDHIITRPSTLLTGFRDVFGNWCNRLVAPPGNLRITTGAVVRDGGQPDPVSLSAGQIPIEHLPFETLGFLRPSRFCESDRLVDMSWELFGRTRPGWDRVQGICDFVHNRIAFSYENARATRTAAESYQECIGVCRDYAHLAIAF